MLLADLMKRPDNGSLEERPDALNAIGVDVPNYPFLGGVVDCLMAGVMILDSKVKLQFVGVDRFSLVFDGAVDEVVQGVAANVRDSLKTNLSAALDRASHPSFVFAGTPACTLRLPTNKRFVNFYDAEQRGSVKAVIPHRGADAMTEIPSSTVGHSKRPLKLKGRHAFLGLAHEVDRRKPLSQRKVGIVHDSSCRHAELIAATEAIPLRASLDPAHVHVSTTDAGHAVRPSNGFQMLSAICVIGEAVKQGD